MKILAVSPHLPYPQIPHAGGVFLLHHLQQLATMHEVHVLVPAAPEASAHIGDVPPSLHVELTPFEEPRPTLSTQWERLRRRARFAAIRTPALRGLRDARIAELAAQCDVVELHWIDTAILTRELRKRGVVTPLAVIAHDVTAESIPARTARIGSTARRLVAVLPDRVRRWNEARDLNGADLVVVFKPQDQDLLRRLGVDTPSHVIEPYLELPPDDVAPARDPRSVLFTGAMWRLENQDGVRWFLDEVWPKVRADAPDATFTVAGASPPEWLVRRATTDPGVVVTGTVPSLDPHYARAGVFVAPLFVAGGLKFKVPQAMVWGLPVVATPLAATGIAEIAPADALWSVTDDPDAMAHAIVGAVARADDAAATGHRASTWARAHFSFERSTRALADRYEELRRTER